MTLTWAGGGLFVGSLALTAHAFLVTWGEPRPFSEGWTVRLTLNALLLTGFAFHHSFFAREGVKVQMARLVPADLVRSAYVWAASVLLIAVVLAWRPIGGEMYHVQGAMAWILRTLQLAGLGFIAASVRAINPLELAGIRPPRTDTALYVQGPYSLVRHPLYLGWVLVLFGAPHMTGDRLAFASLTSAYLVLAVPWEERSLLRLYADAYRQYMQRVRWRVIPFVY